MHPAVKLAKETIEAYVREGRVIEPPENPEGILGERAGAFVSLKKHGQLRGCIGTIEPVEKNLAVEIIKNAISSASRDPRFYPVAEDELKTLDYSVDVLSGAEDVSGLGEMDAAKYGIIVSKGRRKGLLLPALEGVDTAEEQYGIACMKAGIAPNEEGVRIQRFTVRRFK